MRRSVQLFKARPTVGLVVVLFTLVTSGIQVFALGAGLDVLVRAGEAFHLSFAAGGLAIALAGVLVFAGVVAFGSLLFTIAVLVSAPQVTAFLGLTHFAGGLDQARVDGPRPRRFRWVTLPMLATMAAMAVLATIGLLNLPAG